MDELIPDPHCRYVRGLGRSAGLFAVTAPGIEDFLAAPEAALPGVVVLADDVAEAPRVIGGPRVGEILRLIARSDPETLAAARPLAVVAIEAGDERSVGEGLAASLRALLPLSASRASSQAVLPERFAGLADVAPAAIAHVIGRDPFAPRALH